MRPPSFNLDFAAHKFPNTGRRMWQDSRYGCLISVLSPNDAHFYRCSVYSRRYRYRYDTDTVVRVWCSFWCLCFIQHTGTVPPLPSIPSMLPSVLLTAISTAVPVPVMRLVTRRTDTGQALWSGISRFSLNLSPALRSLLPSPADTLKYSVCAHASPHMPRFRLTWHPRRP
jgi:hypothetical protein